MRRDAASMIMEVFKWVMGMSRLVENFVYPIHSVI